MPRYKVKTIVRPEPYFVFPLVKPTGEGKFGQIARYDGEEWLTNYHDMELGLIWSRIPTIPTAEHSHADALIALDKNMPVPDNFLALIERFKDEEFGTKLPPFEFPRFKPLGPPYDFIRVWRPDWRIGGAWIRSFVRELKDDQLWWPSGDLGEQLYGRPDSAPLRSISAPM